MSAQHGMDRAVEPAADNARRRSHRSRSPVQDHKWDAWSFQWKSFRAKDRARRCAEGLYVGPLRRSLRVKDAERYAWWLYTKANPQRLPH